MSTGNFRGEMFFQCVCYSMSQITTHIHPALCTIKVINNCWSSLILKAVFCTQLKEIWSDEFSATLSQVGLLQHTFYGTVQNRGEGGEILCD